MIRVNRSGFGRLLSMRALGELAPGLLLTGAIALAAYAAEWMKVHLTNDAVLENLVLAILIGMIFRSTVKLPEYFEPGIRFAAKALLEAAIVLLGASISLQALEAVGLLTILGITCIVGLSIVFSYSIGRGLGLHHKLALLVACGNSICGNSAIVAAAPVIRAEASDVAASIAFTAILGIAIVLGLPLLMGAFSLDAARYGTLAGLTVYAVPQVLAAAQPGGLIAVQTGALVKLVRVMLLGPVLILLGVLTARGNTEQAGTRIAWRAVVPWFIIGFGLMVALRSAEVIPLSMVEPINRVSGFLTVLSMAGLGLAVDIRKLANACSKVMAAALLSVLALTAMSLVFVKLISL
ncbi:YeiH family protein [Roseibium litorale]|uniref:Sulfate exporter family transporter n=1 Tax=Roseibium litorale TaxID=2803841 RepID=A0ABR9CQJ3_9HYPH|nr:putative sulfate exporter family transporter [Roseibium litorale]MBD8892948.1 putative sulfate exporter family transporter [Roseibium litorale]